MIYSRAFALLVCSIYFKSQAQISNVDGLIPLEGMLVDINKSAKLDFIGEYGAAATTIRAFYGALANGQGEIASSYIVPEKRSIPAFKGANMTRFYGSLVKPISLINIVQNNSESFTVKYVYATKSKVCDGMATVTTAVRDGRNFILSIKPLNGC